MLVESIVGFHFPMPSRKGPIAYEEFGMEQDNRIVCPHACYNLLSQSLLEARPRTQVAPSSLGLCVVVVWEENQK